MQLQLCPKYPPNFIEISSVLNKIMLKILWLYFYEHGVDEIGERYAENSNYRLNHAITVKVYHCGTQFTHHVRLSRRLFRSLIKGPIDLMKDDIADDLG